MSDLTLQVGDTETKLTVVIEEYNDETQEWEPVDISASTTREITLRREPEGDEAEPAAITRSASFSTDGEDGKMFILTQSTDLDQAGSWRVQGFVVIGTGQWHSRIGRFRVAANL